MVFDILSINNNNFKIFIYVFFKSSDTLNFYSQTLVFKIISNTCLRKKGNSIKCFIS